MKHAPLIVVGFLVSVVSTFGCHTGDYNESCNADGGCNDPGLKCDEDWRKCHLKPEPKQSNKCNYESECFCLTCADKCGSTGVKTCAYSDTSVWGSKPALCECK